MKPITPRRQTVYAILTLIAGVVMIAFELRNDVPLGGESIFWISLGALAIGLAIWQLIERRN